MKAAEDWNMCGKQWCCSVSLPHSARTDCEANRLIGGLKLVRALDRITVELKIKSDIFKTIDLPRIAEVQAAIPSSEFEAYFPKDEFSRRTRFCIADCIQIKHDLALECHQFKIIFIPPGAGFDPDSMEAVDDGLFDQDLLWSAICCVRMCIWPALHIFSEKEFPDDVRSLADHRMALLAEDSFLPDVAGQYNDWDDTKGGIIAKAKVLVESIADDEAFNEGSRNEEVIEAAVSDV